MNLERALPLNIGHNNFIISSRILSVATWETSAIRKSVQVAKEKNLLINATCGKKTRSVIFMDNGNIVLSALLPETIASRISSLKNLGNSDA